ncbi:MAG: LPS export ABC transporter permease LptG [Sphingomonadaceae bacterium]
MRFLDRLFPSPTLARYTARLFLLRTLGFLAGLVLILQTLDLLGESGRILAIEGNGEAELWRYVSLRLPQLIALFLPFSVLLATLLTFMTLNQNSEIVIFKAAGLSAHQILSPLILAGLLVAGVSFLFNERVLTRAQETFDRWKAVEYRPIPPPGKRPGDTWVRSGNDLIRAGAVSGEGDGTRLSDVTVFDRVDDRLVLRIDAAAARPIASGWQLIDGRRFDLATGTQEPFETLELPLAATPEQFNIRDVEARHTPFWHLLPALRALEAAGRPTAALRAQAHHKIAGPMSAALMPLLGAVAAFGLARSGKVFLRAVIGLALGFLYFVTDNFAMAMADFGNLPPIVAAWAPFLLFLLVGESVLFRTEE